MLAAHPARMAAGKRVFVRPAWGERQRAMAGLCAAVAVILTALATLSLSRPSGQSVRAAPQRAGVLHVAGLPAGSAGTGSSAASTNGSDSSTYLPFSAIAASLQPRTDKLQHGYQTIYDRWVRRL